MVANTLLADTPLTPRVGGGGGGQNIFSLKSVTLHITLKGTKCRATCQQIFCPCHLVIPMGTNCAPLVADLFLFCYERDFMLSLSDNYQTVIIEAFNSTSRYLDDLILIILILNKW